MTPELTARLKREYNTRQEAADDALANAMLWAYREMTGKKPSNRFCEKIADAIRFDQ